VVNNKHSNVSTTFPHNGGLIEVKILEETLREDILRNLETELTTYLYE